ncbi:hypothetical protein AB0C84_40410 [Actinomadura sp. NPDC048955]|uniref:hypothetical protein n=1 Tax=Actinomadura sp. NPDC048955 TaxID=3158228 RepID=UPI0033BFEADD
MTKTPIRVGTLVSDMHPMPVLDPHRLPHRGEVVAINESRQPAQYLVQFIGDTTRVFSEEQLEHVPKSKWYGEATLQRNSELRYIDTAARIARFKHGGLPVLDEDQRHHDRALAKLAFSSDLHSTLVEIKLREKVARAVTAWEAEAFRSLFPVETPLGDVPSPEQLQELVVQVRTIQHQHPGRISGQRYLDTFQPMEVNLARWYGIPRSKLRIAVLPLIDEYINRGLPDSLPRDEPESLGVDDESEPTSPAAKIQQDFPELLVPGTTSGPRSLPWAVQHAGTQTAPTKSM